MTKPNILNITTIVGLIAWGFLIVYFYCSNSEQFFNDHTSLHFYIGSLAIYLSISSAIVSALMSTFCLIKYEKCKQIFVNVAISYSVAGVFLFLFFLAKITGGA